MRVRARPPARPSGLNAASAFLFVLRPKKPSFAYLVLLLFLSAFHQDSRAGKLGYRLHSDCFIQLLPPKVLLPSFLPSSLPPFLLRFISPTDKKVLTEELLRRPPSPPSS